MTKIAIIGDVHGDFDAYVEITKTCERSIQIGDFGAGFSTKSSNKLDEDGSHMPMLSPNHKFIRGNHDNPALCKMHPNWIPDVTVEGNKFFMGGAHSIDQRNRNIGINWWDDEELSYEELNNAIDIYAAAKPRYVFTHDCPEIVGAVFFGGNSYKVRHNSSTMQALSMMFDIHQPEAWFFGHYHQYKYAFVKGTRFVCVPILTAFEYDFEED